MERQFRVLAVALCVSMRAIATAHAADNAACSEALVDANPDQAIKACTDIIEDSAGSTQGLVVALSTRGNAYYDKGLTDRAIEDFDQAITLNPDYAEAFYDRGSAYLQKRSFKRALQEFSQAIKLKTDYVDAYNNRGYVFYQQGDFDHALRDFDKVIDLNPKHATATYNRGLIYFFKGDCPRAMQDFARAKSLNRQYDIPDAAAAACSRTASQ
jgi:tetratricopeptide (TPR) repeat protein